MRYESPAELYQQLSPLLQEKLNLVDTDILKTQLVALDVKRYELAYTRAQWHEKLVNERERLRMPKSSELTEFDRRTMSDANIAAIERDYLFMLQLEEIIHDRLELGKAFL